MMLKKEYWKNKSKDFFRAVDIPENLNTVTDINEASEVDAEEAGLSHAAVNNIWSAVEDFYATGMYPGLSFCLRKNGKVVLNRALGFSRGVLEEEGIDPVPMTTETPVCLYSASKAVMAVVVHKLAEDGYVNLLDPVSHYIPEFGQKGKKNISIYQMLAHRGGFPTVERDVPLEQMFDRESIMETIYQTQAICEEGRIQAYHAVTSGFVADELVRRTTGKTINEYMDEKFRKPMGMKNFTFGLDEDQYDEVALNYVTGVRNGKVIGGILEKALGVSIEDAAVLSNTEGFYSSVIPSANLYATAEEINRFYQMLLDYGHFGDQQLMKPTTITTATREADKMRFDASIKLPIRFSAGFMLGGKPIGMYGMNTHNAFGHLGFSNIFCWADPERDISVSVLTTGKPVIGNHLLALPKLMHTISSQCEPCEKVVED